ncbi:MAG: helix-turn-helix domain-containing protein [Betaproteobacteria bacterium]|nr:helix-turn-helix domain-containing protein [Betaproteobacteria bacterium]
MDRLLTRQELAERLGVSAQTVDRMAARGDIRVHRVGKAPRFLWSEILQDTAEQPVSMAQALRRV